MLKSNYFLSKELIINKIDEICEQGGIDIDLESVKKDETRYTKLSQKEKLKLKDDILIEIFYHASLNLAYKFMEEEEMLESIYDTSQTIH